MSDWRTYAKAARNTARRGSVSARSSASVYAQAARRTVRRQAPEVQRAVREQADRNRRTAAAYTVVAGRRARSARLGQRLKNALRDAVLVGAAIGVIWFVVTRTGVPIPPSIVLAAILILMLVRFGYALFAVQDTTVGEDNELEGGFGERREGARELDPREIHSRNARAARSGRSRRR